MPDSLLEQQWFGVVMNTGHFLHRRGYRQLWENMLALSPKEIPLEVFLAVCENREEAERMHYEFNSSLHTRKEF